MKSQPGASVPPGAAASPRYSSAVPQHVDDTLWAEVVP